MGPPGAPRPLNKTTFVQNKSLIYASVCTFGEGLYMSSRRVLGQCDLSCPRLPQEFHPNVEGLEDQGHLSVATPRTREKAHIKPFTVFTCSPFYISATFLLFSYVRLVPGSWYLFLTCKKCAALCAADSLGLLGLPQGASLGG